jgi:glycosyltransferase involved in cell wall biosynthesis
LKVAFVYSFKKSHWKSCQTISTNLLLAYKNFLNKDSILSFDLNDLMTPFEILKSAQAIFEAKPNAVVIVDHKPHPKILLKCLDNLYSEAKSKRPQIIIHVFGDFTLYGKDWMASEKHLKNFNVKFVCASERQKNLVSEFLKNKHVNLYKCPFPVNAKEFYYSPEIRNAERKKLGIKPSTTVFLYTGRMSYQKKSIELMYDFAQFLKITKTDAMLFLAGDFDDIGNPFTGIYSRDGEYCQRYMNIRSKLANEIKDRIIYLGNLDQEQLLAYYNLADTFVSLSVHNDEDYGMSPAEAICTGLPAILTDWAGYASFSVKEPDNKVSLIPVTIGESKIAYERQVLVKAFTTNVVMADDLFAERVKIEKINAGRFSVNACTEVLKNILSDSSQVFKGFTANMDNFARVFGQGKPPFAVYKYETNYSDLYKKVYANYIQE